jgi:importin subunit alpha-2
MVIIRLEKKPHGLLQMLHLVVHPNKSSNSFLSLIISFHSSFVIRYIIEQGAIPPLCELLSVTDAKIIQVALNGLDNILKLGAAEAKRTNGANPYAIMIEECYGLDKIEYLQSHENIEIYQKAFHLIETYFGVDEEENVPAVNESFFNFYLNSFLFF